MAANTNLAFNPN